MKQFIFFVTILFVAGTFLHSTSCGQNTEPKQSEPTKNLSDSVFVEDNSSESDYKEISILFLGDIMQHDLQIQSAFYAEKNEYDFHSQFENVKPIFDSTDVVVGNFEVTLNGPPYAGYPKFSSPDALAVAVKEAGINYLALANNHIFDYGKKGFHRTLKVLDSLNFYRTGAFYDKADKEKYHPLVIEENGFKIALFNYSYGTNEASYLGGTEIMNIIDSSYIQRDLQKSMQEDFDARIIFFHWGKEYERLPSEEEIGLEKFCYENGADIVIGAHSHVIGPMKHYTFTEPDGESKEVLTAYSLGNFVSNYATWRYCDGGAMIRFTLAKDGDKPLQILNPHYHLIWVYRPFRNDSLRRYSVLPVLDFEDDKSISGEFRRLFDRFINDSRSHLNKHNIGVPEAKKQY